MNFIKHPDDLMGIYLEEKDDEFGLRIVEVLFNRKENLQLDEQYSQFLSSLNIQEPVSDEPSPEQVVDDAN